MSRTFNKAWCMFEQSGTFKNEFIKLGIPAVDLDIQNNFGETDYVIDLFAEIDKGFEGGASIFDNVQKDDIVMAFFPCIYFCENNDLYFRGDHQNLKGLSQFEKTKVILQRAKDREFFYEMILKLYGLVCENKINLVIENPYSVFHYLQNNFPEKPSVIDKDRTRRGDYYTKPTQYWFVNFTPTFGTSFQKASEHKVISTSKSSEKAGLCSEERSLISPDYARNFICDFILGKEQENVGQGSFDFEEV